MPERAVATVSARVGDERDVRVPGLELAEAREDQVGQHARPRRGGQQLAIVVAHLPKPVESPRMKKR